MIDHQHQNQQHYTTQYQHTPDSRDNYGRQHAMKDTQSSMTTLLCFVVFFTVIITLSAISNSCFMCDNPTCKTMGSSSGIEVQVKHPSLLGQSTVNTKVTYPMPLPYKFDLDRINIVGNRVDKNDAVQPNTNE